MKSRRPEQKHPAFLLFLKRPYLLGKLDVGGDDVFELFPDALRVAVARERLDSRGEALDVRMEHIDESSEFLDELIRIDIFPGNFWKHRMDEFAEAVDTRPVRLLDVGKVFVKRLPQLRGFEQELRAHQSRLDLGAHVFGQAIENRLNTLEAADSYDPPQ